LRCDVTVAREVIVRIFVTGATGVVGRRLVPLLCSGGHDVTAVARSDAGRLQVERYGASGIDVDLFDPHAVYRAVRGHDAVVNLATRIPHPLRMFLPWAWRENDRLRSVASATLVDACMAANVPRFIQESFGLAYPDCGSEWIDETTPLRPVRYNRTIGDAEASADRFSRSGRAAVVLRFGAFYGPDALQTRELIKSIRRGWAPVPGRADAYLSSVSHDDAATAVAAAIAVPSGSFNVVDDEPVTHRMFVQSLAEALGVGTPRLPPAWLTPLLGSLGEMAARSVRMSNRKFRLASGWAPKYASVRHGWTAVIEQLRAAERGGGQPHVSRHGGAALSRS
jgi:2-alkyl-3-oxoalkanoate reductase